MGSLDNTFTAETLSFDTGANVFGIDANASESTARTLTLTGGTNALGMSDLIALSGTTTGTVTLGGTARVGTLELALGASGTGTFTQSGGTHTVSSGIIFASETGSSGSYTPSGTGMLSATYEYVGRGGSAPSPRVGARTPSVAHFTSV